MASPLSQLLTGVGLLLEFLSVFIPVRAIFFRPRKERYDQKMKKIGRTVSEKLDDYKKEAVTLVILLGSGLLLQGIAMFV